jgi:hypothetical protein
MQGIDPDAFSQALAKINDGFIFENFAQGFLSKVLGYDFIPVGGLKDRGIDGLEHLFHREGVERAVFQISIERDPENKLRNTFLKLQNNNVPFDRLYFVTNQVFPNKDRVIDALYDEFEKQIIIFDVQWFCSNVNSSVATVNSYHTFIESYLHEFNRPGKSYEISDLVTDPRLFVFLQQQWEDHKQDLSLTEILADTLILYVLEGTDPDKNLFKGKAEIIAAIAQYISFDISSLKDSIDSRLNALTKKPNRKVNYHRQIQGYCLPYNTRVNIHERNIKDAALLDAFMRDVENKLRIYLKEADVRVKDCAELIKEVIHRIFYQQGLEFADFVIKGENQTAFEKSLPDTINYVVENSSVVTKNKAEVKSALLVTIRDLVYNGSDEQKLFLQKLSNTYMMLFLLRCDPKIATYFEAMASQWQVYVCPSIIIPAMSEYYLEPQNQRYASLLKGAHNAGVQLIVNDTIVEELISHFTMVLNHYEQTYKDTEEIYLEDEMFTLYIDEILIRAYFYAKRREKVKDFRQFVDTFINPSLTNPKADIIEWLKTEFGIRYQSYKSLKVKIDGGEYQRLFEALKMVKKYEGPARNDSQVILTIYALRRANNEEASLGIFGFRTWWLSTDTVTQRTVNQVFGQQYKISCYIRPDFLYNYIALAPKKRDVDNAYRSMFPTLLGVNISSNLPSDVAEIVHQSVKEHSLRNPARLKSRLRELAERLQTDDTYRTKRRIRLFLDEEKLKPNPVRRFSRQSTVYAHYRPSDRTLQEQPK